jgi:polar amino acid transport system substrate-binding protein
VRIETLVKQIQRNTQKLMIHMIRAALLLFAMISSAHALTLAVEDAWEPYANPDETGMSVDIVKAAFSAVGIKVTFEAIPYARLLQEVQAGNYVGGFNVAREPSREDAFLWGREMLFLAQAHYYHYRSRLLEASSSTGLQSGEKVGVILGYEYGELFHANNRISKVWGKRHDQIIRMLQAGRVDTVILFEKTANLLLTDMNLQTEVVAAFPSEPSRIYVAFSRQHPEARHYMEMLDEGLARIKANGEYQAILKKY